MSEKMYSIALCDDDKVFAQLLKGELSRYLGQRKAVCMEDAFYDAKSLLEALHAGAEYDLYMLDIDMPGIDGMETAEAIRRKDPESGIIFVSAMEEMVYESFRVKPLYFVRKSHFREDLPKAADLFLREQAGGEKEKSGCVIRDEAGKPYSVSFSETFYFEASDKYVKMITAKENVLIRSTISRMETELSGYGFVRAHRSFLVNLRKIYAVQYDKIVLDDGTALPLARNRADEVKKRFALGI